MNLRLLLACIFGLLYTAETPTIIPGSTTANQLTHQGWVRTYLLHVPAAAATSSIPRTVVFCLHGGGGTASGQESISGFSTKAEQVGCIVVYPEGVADPATGKRNFADGRGLNYAEQQGVDDVAFIAALLDVVAAATPVDRLRVYACGLSNGGLMSHRLGEQLSERIAAIAPIAANLPQPLATGFHAQVPVAVLQMSGTADAYMPYAGGEVLQNGVAQVPTLGYVTSAAQAVALWTASNQAGPSPVHTAGYATVHAAIPDDGCLVDRYDYAGPSGGDVVFLSITGGGHTWPSGQNPIFLGNVCRDIAGTDEMWAFFSAHPKQSPALMRSASATTVSGSPAAALSVAAIDAGALSFTWSLTGPGSAILTGNGGPGAHDLTATCPVAGTWNATVSIRNALGLEISSQTSFTINPPAPAITSTLMATGTINTAFNYQITATNSPTGYSATGLPAGLSINTSTGAITGMPTTAGSSNVTISATNAGGTGSATLVITVNPPAPVITSTLTATGTTNTAFNYQITATNSPTGYSATGLPAGLSINTSTGAITGTLTTVGSSNVTISATNAGGTGTATLVITISSTTNGGSSGSPSSGGGGGCGQGSALAGLLLLLCSRMNMRARKAGR